ncbi:fibronectin type III domain-containing protein [Natrinema sp. CBA1119]|uniref:fibronectin type III domain-containing protein n=1 Tax=Natrinema sp. CBA1119 TaxID=1608465 RepID=UPI0020D27497|nr:fibronectin type III domain-containing protein [Natrinema sp. CBA1119]
MPATFTTDLPDAQGLSLDASDSETLTATWDDVINNGEFRLEIRDDDPEGDHPPYELETTVSWDGTLQHTIENILGGEQYSVRIRTETNHVTGEWLAAEEITKLLASDSLSFSNVTATSATVSWMINNDFRGSHVVYRRRTDYDYDGGMGRLVGTVASDASSFVDDSVQPDRGFEYQVRTLTQWQYADSGTETTTTDDAGLAQSPTGSQGWHVEIDHPSGTVLTPEILDDLERRPTLNEQTQIDIPVPRNERWLSADLEGAPVRAWKDGQRLPIDKLAEDPVEISADRAVLHAIGGEELDKRVTADVTVEPAPDLVRRLIQENTGLVANVDDVQGSVQETDMQVSSTQTDWEAVTQTTNLDRLPFTIQNGDLDTQDACFPRDALADNDRESVVPTSGDRFNDGQAAFFSSDGYYTEFEITPAYDIPADQVGAKVRTDTIETGHDGTLSILWDGTAIASTSAELILGWDEIGSDSFSGGPGGYQAEVGQDLQAGETYTLRIESNGNTGLGVDAIAVYDQRFSFTWSNPDAATNAGGYLDGPEPRPIPTIDLDEAESIFSVIGGELTADFDDVSDGQQVGIRNVSGGSFQTASNSETVSHDWADPGAMIQAQLTLGRYGTRDAFPATGFEGQTVSSYTLSATLDDTPLVIDQVYNDDLGAVLATIAKDTYSIMEVTWDDAAGSMAIEWTRPGQRTSDQDLEIVDYTTRKVAPNIQRAIVKGGAQPVREEAFTADVGTAVDLGAPINSDDAVLVPGSDRVVDVNSNVYSRGSDYEISRNDLTITVLADGTIPDGTDCLIDYEYKVVGEFETGHYSGDPREEHVETIPQLTTERGCAQAAKVIVDKGSEARTEADVSLPPSIPVDLSLVEELRLEDVPGDAMAIYELQDSPQGLELRLGDRARVDETVRQIQSQLSSNSERV